jgi:hypothetical protein
MNLLNIKFINSQRAKFIGSIYFLLLGLINFVATFLNSEVRSIDTITLLACILPLAIGKKWFLFLFGVLGVFISTYVIIGGLVVTLRGPVQTSGISLVMGCLFIVSMLLVSLLLIYASSGAWHKSIVLKQAA